MPKLLFDRIVSDENMQDAFRRTQLGKGKYKKDAILFARNQTYNIKKLQQSLIDETYEFDDYEEFTVYEPKERIINAPRYKDKVVQIAINNVLKEVYNPCFIYDSYACIDGKGTHKCVERINYFIRKAKWQYGEDAYIIKMDIKKFFYTINRNILKKILANKIKCKKTLMVLYKIIDSADKIDELGLPLGNTISQICANIYMNELDQYAKRKLGIKYYVRFADDICIVVKNKEKAQETLNLLVEFLNTRLHLQVNKKKTKIFPIRQGVNSIGFKIHTTHRLLRNDSKKRVKRKLRKMKGLFFLGRLTIEKAEQMLNSWLGHSRYGCNCNFVNKLVSKYDFLYLNNKGNFKINRGILIKEWRLNNAN